MLIDFGAAREVVTRTSRALSPLQVVKDGYSPQEFYLAGGKQSEASDIYSLAATFYHLMTGTAPPNSQVRIAALAAGEPDPYVPVPPRTEGFDRFFLGAIDDALAVFQKDRLQSAVEWIQEIDKERRLKKLAEKAKEDANIDLSIKRLLEESNTDMFPEEDGRPGQQVGPGPGTPAPESATAMKTRPGQPAGKIDAGKRIASTDPASAGQSSGAMPDRAIQPDGTSITSPRRRSLLTRIASVPILLIKGGKPNGKSRDHGFERHNQ